METPRRWIAYDTFKLIVALLLLVILLISLLQGPAIPPTGAAEVGGAAAGERATQTPLTAALAATRQPEAVATNTSLAVPASTATSQPAASATAAIAPTQEPTAEPTQAPTTEAASASTPSTASTQAAPEVSTEECSSLLPSRLTAGSTARILSNLNLRSEPLIGDNIIGVNLTGRTLKLLDGPVCVPHEGSAYLWWQVEAPDGQTGWSAENFINGQGYYLSPE